MTEEEQEKLPGLRAGWMLCVPSAQSPRRQGHESSGSGMLCLDGEQSSGARPTRLEEHTLLEHFSV